MKRVLIISILLGCTIYCNAQYPIIPWDKQIEVYQTVAVKFINQHCADGENNCKKVQSDMLDSMLSKQVKLHSELQYTKKDEDGLVKQLQEQFSYLDNEYFNLVRVKQATLVLEYKKKIEPDFND